MAKIEDFNKEAKRRQSPLYKVKTKIHKGQKWIKDNPSEAMRQLALAAAIGSAIAGIAGAGAKAYKAHSEQVKRDYQIYDHSTGMYLNLNRKMSNNDHVRLQQLRNEGMSQTEALLKMGLLK